MSDPVTKTPTQRSSRLFSESFSRSPIGFVFGLDGLGGDALVPFWLVGILSSEFCMRVCGLRRKGKERERGRKGKACLTNNTLLQTILGRKERVPHFLLTLTTTHPSPLRTR